MMETRLPGHFEWRLGARSGGCEGRSTSLRKERPMSETNTVSPLRQRMIEDMAARKLNPHTQQGNRLNVLCGDVGGEGVFVPCGDFAAHAQRILAFAGSQHVEGAVLDDSEVEGGVVGSHAAFVVAEDHVGTQWRPFSTIQ